MTLIADTPTLAAFCERQKGCDFITVDTEFVRERTYWPKLCLLQIGGEGEAAAIDALADGIDLSPCFELLSRRSLLKVFHAGRQDLEIFYHVTGELPAPVFDSQVAAMVCGFGDAAGYETLVARLTKARIDKSSRFTDWAARPLTKRQISYALADVTHLRAVYEKLRRRLDKNGRGDWLAEEMAVLTARETYDVRPEDIYRRIKTRGATPRFLAILREVAAWREREAQRLDVPRNHMLRDDALIEIAHHTPANPRELGRVRGLSRRMAEGAGGGALLDAVKRGQAVADADCPPVPARPDLPRGIGPVSDLLKVLLKMQCDRQGVAQKLIASSSDIDLLAAQGEDADIPALRGWRRDVFGEEALRLRRGDLALKVNGRRLTTVRAPKSPPAKEK